MLWPLAAAYIDDADDHDDDDNEYDELLSILLKRKCQSENAKAQFSSALWPVFGHACLLAV